MPCILLLGEPSSNEKINSATGSEVEGLKLTISTTNKVFQLGQPIHLSISLQNVTTNNLVVPTTGQIMSVEVIGPDGKAVQETAFGTKMLHPTIFVSHFSESLSPDQNLRMGAGLTAWFCITNSGEYTVTVLREIAKTKHISAGPLKIRIIQ